MKIQYASDLHLELHWVDPTQKEVEDVSANQDRLIVYLRKIVDVDKPYLLDGHFCLKNTDGQIENIPLETFKAIDPEFIVLLEEDIELVSKRLNRRDGKTYDSDFLTRMASSSKTMNSGSMALNVSKGIFSI